MITWLRNNVETVINLHLVLEKAMTSSQVLALLRMLAMAKAYEDGFGRQTLQIAKSSLHIVQQLQYQILLTLQGAKVCHRLARCFFQSDLSSI